MKPPVAALAGSPGVTSQPEAAIARRDVADRAAKIFVVALFTMMAVNLGVDFAETGRSTGLLLLASEALVVVLTICRRAPLAVDRSVRARVLTTMSLVGPPLVQPATTLPLASEIFTAVFAAIGLLIVIGGKMSLGRSFGLMPANRGIVSPDCTTSFGTQSTWVTSSLTLDSCSRIPRCGISPSSQRQTSRC